jgi:Leucine-rich repeat (LRR) protein
MMAENPDDLYDGPTDPEKGQPDTSQLPNVEELRSDAAHAGGSSKRKRNFIILGVVLVLIAVIIGVSVGVTQSKQSGGTPSNASLGPADDWADIEAARIRAATNFVVINKLSDKTAVETTGTPQNKAVDFMAIGDEAQFDIPLETTDPDAFKFIQRYALAVFYYSLGGDDWAVGLNQMTKADTCQWYDTLETASGFYNFGVTCNGKGQVNYLLIPSIKLKGTLPAEIGLSSITFFAMIGNKNVTGPIPDAFRKLSNIEIMYLKSNALTGSIPNWIGELTNLTELSLGDNQLTSTIPSSMKNLTELKFLSLDGNMLTGDIEALETLTGLSYLYLEHNMLSQRIDGTTLDGLADLKQLDLSDNEFFGIVPEHLLGFPDLDVLDLSDNLLAGSLPEFPPNIALNFFFIHNCSLSGSIPESIKNLSGLNHLDLSENELTGEIPSTLGNLTNMIYLFLSYNSKLEPGPIPEFIQDLSNLSDLSLKGTNRNGPIPTWFGEMQNLLLLDLHRNELTGAIPSELANAPLLALLLLNRNRLNGTIPDDFETMTNLVMLMLDNNTITGPTTSVCKAPNLEVFSADCGGDTPRVKCPGSCCTLCCDGVTKCNDGGLLARFDPIWEETYERRIFNFSEDLVFVPVPPGY